MKKLLLVATCLGLATSALAGDDDPVIAGGTVGYSWTVNTYNVDKSISLNMDTASYYLLDMANSTIVAYFDAKDFSMVSGKHIWTPKAGKSVSYSAGVEKTLTIGGKEYTFTTLANSVQQISLTISDNSKNPQNKNITTVISFNVDKELDASYYQNYAGTSGDLYLDTLVTDSSVYDPYAKTQGLSLFHDAMTWSDPSGNHNGLVAGITLENVPEPTSGLLMLLGLAGLALKRKRA